MPTAWGKPSMDFANFLEYLSGVVARSPSREMYCYRMLSGLGL